MTPHSAYVWHNLHCKWHHIQSFTSDRIYEVTSTSGMTSQPLYQTSHPLYLCHHNLSTDITPTIVWHYTYFCVRSYSLNISWHPILMSSHYCTDDITTSIYETISSVRATYTLNMWHHSHYLCPHTHCIDNITPTLFMTSQSPYVWHRLHYTRNHILIFDLKPQFWGHHTHSIIHVHCIFVITPTLSIISQPLYVWYHIQYMWDFLSTIFMTSYPICISQTCVLITPCSAYIWHHLCYRRRNIHSITASHNLYDFTSTSGMTSHPHIRHHTNCILVITCSPLISHPLLYDITCTICVTSYALYITSYPLLMSSHYSTYDSTNLTYETTSSMQFKIYTIHVTSQSLVCVITPTLCITSHSA